MSILSVQSCLTSMFNQPGACTPSLQRRTGVWQRLLLQYQNHLREHLTFYCLEHFVLAKALNRLLSGTAWLSHLVGEQISGEISVTDG